MKIFYAVQATGNGHISRASELYPYLQNYGDVHFMLSGSNATLQTDFPVKYRSLGLSLFYSNCGGLDYRKIIKKARLQSILNDANALPLEKYDVIINDFDFVTSQACKKKKLRSIHFGHQASFQSKNCPRPVKGNLLGEFILKNYVRAEDYVGLHFRSYDKHIFPPVIRKSILNAKPKDEGHITVYLPAHDPLCLEAILKEISPVEIHWFLPNISDVIKKDNITYFPVDKQLFNESLIHCHGMVTAGGFETPAEALFLKKKLLTIPIIGQYEQQCNGAALEQLGVKRLEDLNQLSKTDFFDWIKAPSQSIPMPSNSIEETLEFVFQKS